jgi:polysaccharide pyruvyl transferase WcaK-like protein
MNKKILLFGTFDVDNYGDLLFPVVANWRIGENLVAISPTANKPSFNLASDIVFSSFKNLLQFKPSTIIVGGGNILHFEYSSVFPYQTFPLSYAGLQFYPLVLKRHYQSKILYNAPSIVYSDLTFFTRIFFRLCFSSADYLSFRDQKSVRTARSLFDEQVFFVPDTAFDISRVWPKSPQFRPTPKEYLIIHVNQRYGGLASDIAIALDSIHLQTNFEIVFLPIGPCHGDISYAKKISGLMRSKSVVVEELELYRFAQYIANSEMYLGSSMHGFITALSYGVKAALVLNQFPMAKFQGVLDMSSLSRESCFSTWLQVPNNLNGISAIDSKVLESIFQQLDTHWQRIKDIIDCSALSKRVSPVVYGWKPFVYAFQFLRKAYNLPRRIAVQMIRSMKTKA